MWREGLKACWKFNYHMMGRYLFNTLSGLVTLYIVFALMFFGVKAVGAGGLNLGDTLEGLFAGYITWMLALMGSTDLAWNITGEAQTGTLEQLYLSPVGFPWLMLFNQSFNFIMNVATIAVIVGLMCLTTGQRVNLDIFSIMPVALSVYIQALGIGFILAGLALVYKRIQAFFQVVQFLIVGFFFIPFNKYPWARLLPLALGRKILQNILLDGKSLLAIGARENALLWLVTAGYLCIGVIGFKIGENAAKARGLLGQY